MSFKSDFYAAIFKYQISICIGFGMLGFVVAVLLFTYGNGQDRGGKHYSPYGEILIKNKKELADTLVSKRIRILKGMFQAANDKLSADSADDDLKADLAELRIVLLNSRRELDSIRNAVSDTSLLMYSKYIFPDEKQFREALDSPWRADGTEVKLVCAVAIDTCKLINKDNPNEQRSLENVELQLVQDKREKMISFFNDHPRFGLWLVFTIAQMMMWFLLVPLLTGNLLNLREKLRPYYKITFTGIVQRMVLPLVFIAVFCFLFYHHMVDQNVIADSFFFSNYNCYLTVYAVFGYSVAIFCFGTFLSLTDQVGSLDQATKGKKLRQNNEKLNEQYLSLKAAFDNSFLASAVILSFFVLWTGITINAINNTEAIKFFGLMTGRSLIPEDFVYLLGLVHTCVLLTFYLPVKLKFNSLPITKDPDTEGASSAKGVFATLGASLSTILVTASPLIASLIQKILDAVGQ